MNRSGAYCKMMGVDLDDWPISHVDEDCAAANEQNARNKAERPSQPDPSAERSKGESDDSEREIVTSRQIAHHGTIPTLLDYSRASPPSIGFELNVQRKLNHPRRLAGVDNGLRA